MIKLSINKKHVSILNELQISSQNCICLKYKEGDVILNQGMNMEYLMIVISGIAKVCISSPEGKNLVLSHYIFEGIIGEIELMTNTHIAATSIFASTDFECIGIPYLRYEKELKENIKFLNLVGKELSNKLLNSTMNYMSNALYSGEERLCTYIMNESKNYVFSETLTDVAGSIGMSYRHMFRILNKLCNDNVIYKENNGYHILNYEELRKRSIIM